MRAGYRHHQTIRRGDWKLVYWYADGKKELFNIAEDIGEQERNISPSPR